MTPNQVLDDDEKMSLMNLSKLRANPSLYTYPLPEGKSLMIYICNFHVLSHLLLIYICKLHWNFNTFFPEEIKQVHRGKNTYLFNPRIYPNDLEFHPELHPN